MLNQLKRLLPDRAVPMRVWRGPFRGARVVMNPRASLRKAFGLYEHELNGWLDRALSRVSRVLDVGANDGYFTLGSAAAFRRLGIAGDLVSFEPQARYVDQLTAAIREQPPSAMRFSIVPSMVGRQTGPGATTLDALTIPDRTNTLIKIDVEGGELEVIAGGLSWVADTNLFVIEVHRAQYLTEIVAIFRERGHALVQVDQRPLPFVGGDTREAANWWLVSDLDQRQ